MATTATKITEHKRSFHNTIKWKFVMWNLALKRWNSNSFSHFYCSVNNNDQWKHEWMRQRAYSRWIELFFQNCSTFFLLRFSDLIIQRWKDKNLAAPYTLHGYISKNLIEAPYLPCIVGYFHFFMVAIFWCCCCRI